MVGELCDTLKACLENDTPVIVFAGAGISRNSGMPLWLDATKEAIALAIKKQPAHSGFFNSLPLTNLSFAFECIKRSVAQPVYISILEAVFKRAVIPCEYHHLIVSTNTVGIVTTNYDQLLEDAYAQVHKKAPPRFFNSDDDLKHVMRQSSEFILKMHGDISRPTDMVCATSEYERFYSSPILANLFSKFASTSQFVFIGFSFSDPDFTALWSKVSELTFPKGPPVLIAKQDGTSGGMQSELKRLGVHLVGYSSGPGDHGPALEAVRCLSVARPISQTRPAVEVALPTDMQVLRQVLPLLLGMYDDRAEKSSTAWLVSSLILHELLDKPEGHGVHKEQLVDKALSHLGTRSERWESEVRNTLEVLGSTGMTQFHDGVVTIAQRAREVLLRKRHKSERNVEALLERTWGRARARDGGVPELGDELRGSLRNALGEFIQHAGKLLAESMLFSSLGASEHQLIEKAIESVSAENGHSQAVQAVLKELAFNPDPEDEAILFELFQTGFIVSAYVLNPAAESYLKDEAGRYEVYFDAHVILQALAIGNPSFEAYRKLIQKTRALGMGALVTEGFVEEVGAHYRLASEELAELERHGVSADEAVEAYYLATGERKANAFLLGFRNSIRAGLVPDWSAYSRNVLELMEDVPVTNQVIREVIERKLGIKCIPQQQLPDDRKLLPDITETISNFRKMDKTFRNIKVCTHDAYQLALIYHRRRTEAGKADKVWCVTNDQVMYRFYVNESRQKYPLPPTYTPVKWAQFLDLLEYEPRSAKNFGRLFALAKVGLMDDIGGKQLLKTVLEREHEIFKKGIASIKDFVSELIANMHVRQAAEDYRAAVGRGNVDDRTRAKEELEKQVKAVLSEYVGLRKSDYERLKESRDNALKQKAILDAEYAKLRHKNAAQKKTLDYLNQRLGVVRKKRKRRRK